MDKVTIKMFRSNESITARKFFKDVSQNVNPKFKTKLSQHKEGDAKVFSYVDDTDEDMPYIEYKVFYLENGGFAPVRFTICANDLSLGRKYEKKLLSILDDEGLDTSLYSRKETKFDKSITLEYKGRNLDAVKIKPNEKKNLNEDFNQRQKRQIEVIKMESDDMYKYLKEGKVHAGFEELVNLVYDATKLLALWEPEMMGSDSKESFVVKPIERAKEIFPQLKQYDED